jgi:hypothetical protein
MMVDVVDVTLRAGVQDHHQIVVGQAEDLGLASAFQGAEHRGDYFNAHRRAVAGKRSQRCR